MFAVAIDGPAGAGKSTIARKVAADLSIIYVDTGAMYRAIGAYAIRKGKDTKSAEEVSPLLPEIKLELTYSQEQGQRIYLNGEDVSEEIRRPEMGMAASNVSAIPAVRTFLLEEQRKLAKRQSVIMDGRDIGTVVLPDAEVKIFLTASAEIRARRRWKEFIEKGMEKTFEEVLEDVIFRDKQDMERPIAPLKQADDAVLLDSSDLNFEETVAKVKEIIKERV